MAFRGRTKMARTRIHRSVVTRWRSVMLERTEPGRAHSGSGYRQDPTGTLRGVPQRSPEPCRHRSAAPSPRRTDPGTRRHAVCDIARNIAGARQPGLGTRRRPRACSTSPEGRRREAGAFDKRPQLGPERSAWTRPPRPQSVPAMMFSRPTIAAYRRMRSATSCGCSTRLVAWLTTPGISILPTSSCACCHTRHSCSCRTLAASKE